MMHLMMTTLYIIWGRRCLMDLPLNSFLYTQGNFAKNALMEVDIGKPTKLHMGKLYKSH